ncbi:hypothetical protein [Rhodococcus sp. HS-D2]|uniref:hypothetical protein n=1 Tax=Rhodococcus sp. HS-D2 TaxID=1384636 RepID=UPI0018D42036|nr:hypothetical protein [Rhodococcus sp. HS-D2]
MKVSARGTFVVTVKDIDEDIGLAMIEVNADSPLAYPWPARLTDLVPVEDGPTHAHHRSGNAAARPLGLRADRPLRSSQSVASPP